MITMTIRLTVATLFFSRRFTPSLKKVDDGRILEMYSFSASVAGRKASGSSCCWRLKGVLAFNISSRLLYSKSMRGSTTL